MRAHADIEARLVRAWWAVVVDLGRSPGFQPSNVHALLIRQNHRRGCGMGGEGGRRTGELSGTDRARSGRSDRPWERGAR